MSSPFPSGSGSRSRQTSETASSRARRDLEARRERAARVDRRAPAARRRAALAERGEHDGQVERVPRALVERALELGLFAQRGVRIVLVDVVVVVVVVRVVGVFVVVDVVVIVVIVVVPHVVQIVPAVDEALLVVGRVVRVRSKQKPVRQIAVADRALGLKARAAQTRRDARKRAARSPRRHVSREHEPDQGTHGALGTSGGAGTIGQAALATPARPACPTVQPIVVTFPSRV